MDMFWLHGVNNQWLEGMNSCTYVDYHNICDDVKYCEATFYIGFVPYTCDCGGFAQDCLYLIDRIEHAYEERNKCDKIVHGPFGCHGRYDHLSCNYELYEDACTGELTCEISFLHQREKVTMDCEEFDKHWWESGDNCGKTCVEPVMCENTLFENCCKTECHDTCSQELQCYAEWTD